MKETIKVACISKWHVHAPDFANKILEYPGVEIKTVWDEDVAVAKAWAEELKCGYEADLDAILADPEVDGVIICSSTVSHAELIIRAANAGKHIFVEKAPFSTTAGAYAARNAIKKNNVKFLVSDPIDKPHALYIKNLIDAGKLGKITNVRVRTVHAKGLTLEQPIGFYQKEAGGGGAMMDMGCHAVHTLQYFLGKPVCAMAMFQQYTDRAKQFDCDDNAVAIFTFEGGAIGVAETGWISPNNSYELDVCGTAGTVHVHGKYEVRVCYDGGKWECVPESEMPDPLVYPLRLWTECIKNDTEIQRATIDDAVCFTEMIEAAYRSSGREVRL